MFEFKHGIEIEFTGITREGAAKAAAAVLGGTAEYKGGSYSEWRVKDTAGRTWKFVSDASIMPLKKVGGREVTASAEYKVELVSPILTYRADIDTLQKIIRALRKAGGFATDCCGIHIHLNGADHNARSVRNFVNIVASRNDLFYKALQIEPNRMRYCKEVDAYLVERMNKKKPKTLEQIADIWYDGHYGSREYHYHESRYCFINLHSLFTRNHTIELRSFNSTLHAGKVRSYICLALALNNQALTQKSARATKCQMDNEKFAMRVYLNRIGFIGEEFKNCREHLCKHLKGNAAWRYRSVS